MQDELKNIRTALMVFSANADKLAQLPASNELLTQLIALQENELQTALGAFQRLQKVYQQ